MSNPFRERRRESARPRTRRAPSRRRRIQAVALFTVPVLIGGASLAGCSSSGKKKAVKLVLEAVGEAGAFPFTEHPDTDLRNVVSASPGGGEWQGDARGAFGGVQGTTRCDKASLIKQITADPDKARAWAAVKKIDEGGIGEYINKLTETYLEFDTLVKNHDFRDGQAAEYLSVLQKGVLVLVDDYTAPAVKCNCGNPLAEPDRGVDVKAASYSGTRWKTFSSTEVTVIKARTREQGPVKQVPLVDPFQGDKAFDRSVGSDGSKDSKPFRWDPPKTRPTSGTGGTSGPSGGQGKSSPPPAGSPGAGSSASGSSGAGSEDPSGGSSAKGVPGSESPTGASAGTGRGDPSQSRKPGSAVPGAGRPTPSRTKPAVPTPTASRPVAPPTKPKPVTPTATRPVVPASPKPVTPTGAKPVTPTAARPVTPTAVKPVTPTGVRPVTPTAARPATPTAVKPVTPTAVKPVTPTAAKPVTPTAARPVAPTAARPVAPTAARPVAPTAAKPDAPTHQPPATRPKPPPATHAPAPNPPDPS
ncbi:hypothetical protein FGW37_28835 [Streptomyces rectiverticillatus]|uniref:DUF6777 domain-containing protein n=1 Tax=Streptomyces rectiverticillatus TaxID=173860 RepID=UPI0015C393DD|nr:DUF6777 domain-containing protein [Streptomyces rectiverticillatus]QLE75075.1 hypothetical protein FGW37_28835 [Streptomyces rectiverticillatus]